METFLYYLLATFGGFTLGYIARSDEHDWRDLP